MVKVVFLHPDLGIGGAERSVIDAALALKERSHEVEFVTAHHDVNHCFEETKNGSIKVTSVGDWLPRSIFGRCYALCAYLRMIYAALYLTFVSAIQYDCVFCDQISACIPVLKLRNKKVLFYCHFPDMLLTQRKSFWKRMYRRPIDWLEEKTTGMADVILVNSKFTAKIFGDTFTSLQHITPEILYPIPNFAALDPKKAQNHDDIEKLDLPKGKALFLSINRYERKKNLNLAIKAFGVLKEQIGSLNDVHLVMAGGYDERVTENKEHYLELRQLAMVLDLDKHVTFLRSFSNSEKRILLQRATALLYTPDREHFGIVPIEAMYLKCPVISVKSGGPLETVADGVTGFHCEPTPQRFADAMSQCLENKQLCSNMGEAGRKRVEEKFSFKTFTNQLDLTIDKMLHE